MARSRIPHLLMLSRGALVGVFALFAVAVSAPAAAQGDCAVWVDTLLDTTENCTNEPFRERAMEVEAFEWKGHQYVILNEGNEFAIHQVDDPLNPREVARSRFRFGTRGDSDYDILLFDVCDDCRYGVLGHKVKRTVVFDLGVGADPAFPGGAFDDISVRVELSLGGYVFSKGGQQYLIAADLPGGCAGGSGLYTLDDLGSYGLIECMEFEGSPFVVRGLQTLTTKDGILYLYAADFNGPVRVLRADGAGTMLDLVYQDTPVGMFGQRYELSIDANNNRAASANWIEGVVSIWSLADPAHPVLDHTIPGIATIVSLRSPSANSASTLAMATIGWQRSTRTFVVDDGVPEEFEADFWSDEALLHNDLPICGFETGGTLSEDGSTLFLSRNAVHQVFDLSDCLQPTPAEANLTVTPGAVYPGESVTVTDTSTGRIDRWAVWVTGEPGGTVVAGNATPSAVNPHEISFQVSQSVLAGTSYQAHIVVESDDLTPTDPDFDTPITINRTPAVAISVNPEAVIVGERVDLLATVSGGFPTSYQWEISAPGASTPDTSHTGAAVPLLLLDIPGAWTFKVTAAYSHEASIGVLYQTTDTRTFDVTSVAADFAFSPSSPLHTQQITLDGSISKPSGGNLSFEWRVESVLHDYTSCPAVAVCTIPEASLNPDTTYNVTLKVTNNDDSAISELTKPLAVGNGNVQPTISFRPSNPDIGENILFTINGVPADIDKASWSMGATGCDGADPTPECFPSLWNNCKTQAFKYASQGTRTVRLTIEVGGNVFTAPPVTVTTSSAGSCSGTIPPTPTPTPCSYNLSRSNATFGPAGGDGIFSVTTTAGCSWTAQTTYPWITVLSPTGSDSGFGNVRYRVDVNTGPERVGIINAAGRGFIVTQEAPWAAANFTMSTPNPEIGQVMTFSVDPILEVASWNFGEADCWGKSPVIDCTFLPSGACNTMQWVYPSSGPKTITMVLSDGRDQTKIPTVQPKGECCFADGRPDASFTMSADAVYTGETVVFTDTSSKSAAKGTKAVGITWNPTVPKIGEKVTFEIVGVSGDVRAEWDFGGPGCDVDQVQICNPLFSNCHAFSHTYSSSGGKTVNLTVTVGGSVIGTATNSLTVADVGTCDDGGGGCSYTLSKYSASFPPEGGSGSFEVNTTAECTWSTNTTSSWLTIDSSGGTGPGSVAYTVDANGGLSSRTATIKAAGKTFRVNQTADEGDTAPSSWQWTVTQVEDEEGEPVDVDVFTSTQPNTSYEFEEPGRYRITLIATNCVGFDSTLDYVTVEEALVEDFVVGAAVSQDGAYDTRWESDFRFYNPCGEDLDVRIEYQPGNTNNTGVDLVFRKFGLGAGETRIFADIAEAIPGLEGEDITGSVRIESQSDSGCKVLSVSRTFNSTPDGSLGLFVPALPVKRDGREFLDLTGLIHNSHYRSNLRLVNYRDEDVWVSLNAHGPHGDQVGEELFAEVLGHSTKQFNDIASRLGVEGDLAVFSVRVGVGEFDVQAFATVVDNLTSDSVLSLSSFYDENMIWLVGVASLTGVNDSQWRTDLWLHNPTGDWLAGGEVEFVVGDDPDDSYGFKWPLLGPYAVKRYLDIVSDEFSLEETRGYIVLTGADGGPAPQVAARTYNLDPSGGTYGLNLQAFAPDDLLRPGETGYIAGVSNSEDQSVGYRTNMGFLNTDRNGWTEVRITLYDIYGVEAAEPYDFEIAPGQLRQFDIFKKLGVGGVTMAGSIRIEVTSGGGVAVYATEIDNRTQDSIYIPAQRKVVGLPLQ